ncbi:MAG: S8 family serine peptidase [Chloroflexi bacterium]|nr:S8 family serine peptidase [Chloroflexota bacterium]
MRTIGWFLLGLMILGAFPAVPMPTACTIKDENRQIASYQFFSPFSVPSVTLWPVFGYFRSSVRQTQPAGMASATVADSIRPEIAANGQADVLIVLADQADLSQASQLSGKLAKGAYVYQQLRQVADRTQPQVLQALSQLGITGRPLLTVNAIAARLDGTALDRIAARPDVAAIASNKPYLVLPPTAPYLSAEAPLPSLAAINGVENNLLQIRANLVWGNKEWGLHSGDGIVIAGADTGVRWTHQALKPHYRGWDGVHASHDYNWLDASLRLGPSACAGSDLAPCDDQSHGTHTMGTAIGDDGGTNQIGVAPGAYWIACKNMRFGVGSPETYIACDDFFLAPFPIGGGPEQGNPALAPHAITNSWECPPAEGCHGDELLPSILALQAAGIVFISSAGNHGPACGTITTPPGWHSQTLNLGAVDSQDGIAFFSGRGPSVRDQVVGPDLTAPGVQIRSSISLSDNSYDGFAWSGTSMAVPHVAGTVALLWSNAHCLVGDVAMTQQIITSTAHALTSSEDCGGIPGAQIPNNTYGYGRVDAYAAVAAGVAYCQVPQIWLPLVNHQQ